MMPGTGTDVAGLVRSSRGALSTPPPATHASNSASPSSLSLRSGFMFASHRRKDPADETVLPTEGPDSPVHPGLPLALFGVGRNLVRIAQVLAQEPVPLRLPDLVLLVLPGVQGQVVQHHAQRG